MQQQPHPGRRRLVGWFGSGTALVVGVLVAVVSLAVLLRLITTGWGPLYAVDLNVVNLLNRYVSRRPGQVRFWKIVSVIGGPTVVRGAAFLAAVLLWVRHRRVAAVLIAVALGGAALLSGIFKVLVNRGRPVVAVPVENADGGSFPSGHALTCFVAAGVLLILLLPHRSRPFRALLIAGAAAVAAAVGYSRLLLGVHYFTDVLGSWLIGTVWLLIVARVFHRSLARQPRPAASPTPQGGE